MIPRVEIVADGGAVSGVRLASGRVLAGTRIVAAIHPKKVLAMLPEGSVAPRQARRIRDLAETEGLFSACASLDARTHPELPYNVYRLHTDPEGWISGGVFHQLRAGGSGTTLLTMITKSPFSEWRRWENTTTGQRGEEYAAEKRRRADLLLGQAGEIFGPLDGAQVIDAYTPLTLRDWVNSPCGSPYGIMRSAQQLSIVSASIANRATDSSSRDRTCSRRGPGDRSGLLLRRPANDRSGAFRPRRLLGTLCRKGTLIASSNILIR